MIGLISMADNTPIMRFPVKYNYKDFVKYKSLAVRMDRMADHFCATFYSKMNDKIMTNDDYEWVIRFAYYEILRRLKTSESREKFIADSSVQVMMSGVEL